jgi:hypothetical protein
MSHVEFVLPDGVHQAVRRLAKREGIPPDQLMIRALSETVAAERALQELRSRARKGSIRHFRRMLAKVPDRLPVAGDELPAGFKLPRRPRR